MKNNLHGLHSSCFNVYKHVFNNLKKLHYKYFKHLLHIHSVRDYCMRQTLTFYFMLGLNFHVIKSRFSSGLVSLAWRLFPSIVTRRPASADRTAGHQFQATGQPISRTQASEAMTSRLPRYEAKCVQRRCFQCGSVPLRSDIKGTEIPPGNILIPLERQLIALQLCRWEFLYNETLQQTFRPLLSKLSKRRQI